MFGLVCLLFTTDSIFVSHGLRPGWEKEGANTIYICCNDGHVKIMTYEKPQLNLIHLCYSFWMKKGRRNDEVKTKSK